MIVGAMAVRPLIGQGVTAPMVFSIAMLLLMLVFLTTIQVEELVGDREALLVQRRRRSIIAWCLAVPAILERLYALASPKAEMLLFGIVTWLGFVAFVTWSQLRNLLRHKEITGETISLSISIYLLFGLTWGFFYLLLFQLGPDAFNFGQQVGGLTVENEPFVLPTLVYFSLTTLSTVGFGDITPVSMLARYAAVTEAITGQFYLAILVARLVGMQMARASEPHR